MKLINIRDLIGALFLSMLTISLAHARAPEIYLDEGGLFRDAWTYAIDGYDVVAYFDLGAGAAPIQGSDDFKTTHKGAVWRFSTQENLDRFIASPDDYLPAYGGYCAWALARDKLAKGSPDVWLIHEGRLFLNISPRYQRLWEKNLERDIANGDQNWPGILGRN